MKHPKSLIAIVVLLLCLLCAGVCGACASVGDYSKEGVLVVYELEGGTYRSSGLAVKLYYHYTESGSYNLFELATATKYDPPTRPGYVLDGWYLTKNDDGTYADKWDFETDLVTVAEDGTVSYPKSAQAGSDGGLHLYAKWVVPIVWRYEVRGLDAGNQIIMSQQTDADGNPVPRVFDTYDLTEDGDGRFDPFHTPSYKDWSGTRFYYGYTAYAERGDNGAYRTVYYNEDGTEFDMNSAHPRIEDESLIIPVYVKFYEGDFVFVSDKDELQKAVADDKGIWLCEDIDFGGATFNGFYSKGSGKYKDKYFYGNDKTVKNFTLGYDPSNNGVSSDPAYGNGLTLAISLFGALDGAQIRDVTFESFTVSVTTGYTRTKRIILAPLCTMATDSTVTNVAANGTYTLGKIPDGTEWILAEGAWYETEDVFHADTCTFTTVTGKFVPAE